MQKQVFFIQDCVEGCKTRIKSGTVKFVFADPPFNIKFGKNRSAYVYGVSVDKEVYYDDDKPKAEYVEWCGTWIAEAWRVLEENGILVIMTSWNHQSAIENKANEIGFVTINHMVWRYEFGVFTKKKYTTSHYTFLILLKGNPEKRLWTFKPGIDKYQEDVEREVKLFLDEVDPEERRMNVTWIADEIEKIMYTNRGKYSVDDFFDDLRRLSKRYTGSKHACKLSEDVLMRFYETFTDEGDFIVDMFVGGGTSLLAAIVTNRKYIGFEIDPKYKDQIINLVKKRLDARKTMKKVTEL